MLLRIGLVVALDVIEIVEVIHHQTVGLLERPFRRVGEPVKLLEPRLPRWKRAGHKRGFAQRHVDMPPCLTIRLVPPK